MALAAEARTLASMRQRMEVRVCGPGPEAAAAATESCMARRPRLIVSWGVAGALDPQLSPGDLLRPATVASAGSEEGFHCLCPDSPAYRLVSVATPVGGRQERLDLARHSGAVAVDMESASIAAICHREGIPFLCIRAISDGIDHHLPAWVGALMTPDGQLAPWRTLAGVLRDPLALPDLIRAGLGFRRALRSLERYAAQFEP
ncbi:MAG: hypothetical protein JJT88_02800 [Gammaproteobacteria bacterium]|nr:hypothetical protein [Gammaproteobacteria bacterium]